MSRPRVGLRADASAAIGLGHVRRCVSLAKALRDLGADPLLLSRDLGLDIRALAEAAGIACRILHTPAGPDDTRADAAQCIATLRDWSPRAVVVDHYALDASWHRTVREALGSRIVAIDDLGDRPLQCELLIDHNCHPDHRAKYAKVLAPDIPICGGPRFALLDPVFATAPRCTVRAEVDSIGIFMGGVDAAGLSVEALGAVRDAGFGGRVEIVSTRHSPRLATLSQAVREDGQALLTLDLPDLAGFFARHGLHLGAGGGATWERCCIGAPTIAVVVADNQQQVLDPLADKGVLVVCAANRPAMASEVRALWHDAAARHSLSTHAQALVDGCGVSRAAQAILESC